MRSTSSCTSRAQAVDCEDFAGRKRCLKIRPCQCFSGDFQLRPSNEGFKIVPETHSSLTDDQIRNGLVGWREFWRAAVCCLQPWRQSRARLNLLPLHQVGLLPVFRRNQCFDGTSFNFETCDPHDTGCEALMVRAGHATGRRAPPG